MNNFVYFRFGDLWQKSALFRFHYFLIYHIISFSVITVNFLVNCISAHGAWWLLHPIVQCARETRKKSEWIKKYGAKKGKTIMVNLRKRVGKSRDYWTSLVLRLFGPGLSRPGPVLLKALLRTATARCLQLVTEVD